MDWSAIPPWAVAAAFLVLGVVGRDYLDRFKNAEKSNHLQDTAAARYEEKLNGIDQRLNQHAERLRNVEGHASDIADIKARLAGVEAELKSMSSNIATMVELFKTATKRSN